MAELDPIEITKQLTKHHEEIGSLKHRMDEVTKVTNEIHHMATAVEVLALEAKNTGEKVDNMAKKVEKLEGKPAEKAEKVKDTAISSAISVVVGAFLGAILALILK